MKKKIGAGIFLVVVIAFFRFINYSSERYCKDVYQYFGSKTIVYASDAKDCGKYYEMSALIACGFTEDGSLTESVDVVIRVCKNATVFSG